MQSSLPLIVRRCLGSARDLSRLEPRFRAAGWAVGPQLGQALRDDRQGVLLLAERRGVLEGWVAVRWFAPFGAAADAAPAVALIERVEVVEGAGDEVAQALYEAAIAEAAAREIAQWVTAAVPSAAAQTAGEAAGAARAPREAPSGEREAQAPEAHARFAFALTEGVTLALEDTPPREIVTLWSGAQAIRTRWRSDLTNGPEWNHPDTIGSADTGHDVLRFDPASGALRETWFARPRVLRHDPALVEATRNAAPVAGTLVWVERGPEFEPPLTRECLFSSDLSLAAGFTGAFLDGLGEGPALPSLGAVAVSESVAILVSDGVYVGWRALDPLLAVRPMGWPELRQSEGPRREHREALAALVLQWITLDARGVVRPDETEDAAALRDMRKVRDEARRLAALETSLSPNDPLPGVARDIAADVHWRWGFFRVAE
ncbi:MAG: hypothetical protein JNK72_19515 [Myxococcales bacterium]|nr:hypothetical protein [Myxococcales bacterium]